MPAESIAKVDLLLGQATMLTADRWDDLAAMIQEAMGISLLMATTETGNGTTVKAIPLDELRRVLRKHGVSPPGRNQD